jgi:hypothetical protein
VPRGSAETKPVALPVKAALELPEVNKQGALEGSLPTVAMLVLVPVPGLILDLEQASAALGAVAGAAGFLEDPAKP